MVALTTLVFIASLLSTSTASPIYQIGEVIGEIRDLRAEPRQESRSGNLLTGPITFQTVTTSQTQAGTITQTCEVTLTPVTARDGTPAVLHSKQCKFTVGNGGGGQQSSSSSAESSTAVETSTSSQASATETSTSSQETLTSSSTASSSTVSGTAPPAISEIGTNIIPASGSTTLESSSATQSTSSVTGSQSAAPPVVSVVGPSSISNTGNPVITTGGSSTATGTEPITVVTTLSNGQVSTAVSTPTPAAAEAAAQTPGRKLEVLPIGLGVFAGVSVIALIVVGLVTYERTKYRKAFRKRKLAEAGAQMGYGGMAERR